MARRVPARSRPFAQQPRHHRLSELGRREEALATAEQAAVLYRELARQRPDAFRPALATIAQQPRQYA